MALIFHTDHVYLTLMNISDYNYGRNNALRCKDLAEKDNSIISAKKSLKAIVIYRLTCYKYL